MRKFWAALMLGAMALFVGIAPAHAAGATEVVIEDTAGVLDTNTLLPAIDAIKFNEPTKVAIYTREGKGSDNFNEEVLRFARANHPEWLSEDRQKWADSLFIFALDPVGRHVGTYMGEDRKVSLGQREDIQEATKELFRDAQWTEGTIEGVRYAAKIMNRPWYKSPLLWGLATTFGIGGAVTAGTNLYMRRLNGMRSAAALAKGNASFSNVSMDLEVTELYARLIPDSSSYGNLVLEKYRSFMTRNHALAKLADTANALTPKQMQRKENLKLLKEYAKEAVQLDGLDDVIADTSKLLNMDQGWPKAWDRQLAPLKKDIEGVSELINAKHGMAKSSTALTLRSFASVAEPAMEQWASELAEGTLSPEQALDKIRDTQLNLSKLLEDHSETVIADYAKSKQEAELMRKEMRKSRSHNNSDTFSSSIVGTAYPSMQLWSVIGFSSGFRSGRSAVQESRNPSSSGGSTGYGSSGGSFSGSGSSSRF